VAVDPPDDARAHLADALETLHGLPGEPRWTLPERWHLTLLFLGAVPDRQVADLVATLGPHVLAGPLGRLRLSGAGRFGSPRRPQVAWIGLDGDVSAVTGLARRLAAEARRLRLEVEDRPFRPHLTVGRWRPGHPADGAVIDRLAGYRGPDWPVREVRLLESHLGPRPTYETVATWPVG
jgi:RNA 2',3'-cyclic 3'-phosphodiesterase